MTNGKERYRSILLLGPTGSGKTPLGKRLESTGLGAKRFVHFDFGAHLRKVAAAAHPPSVFTASDLDAIRRSLATGALLENENFPLALKILKSFAQEKRLQEEDLLVLNGLPRHVGQARDLEPHAAVEAVIFLDSPSEVIWERIVRNAGGDRAGRTDDSLAEVQNKCLAFRQRTLPLLDYYVSQSVPILKVPVLVDTTPDDVLRAIEQKFL
jgi:adenylate kinase family enzyme